MDLIYTIGTIIGVAGTLILRDWRDGKNVFTKNSPPQQLMQGFDYMRHHYNDELTATLTQIQVDQRDNFRDLNASLGRINDSLIRIESGGVKIKT